MTRTIRWSAIGALAVVLTGCPGGTMRPDAGGTGGGGSLLAGGGSSGVGGGSSGVGGGSSGGGQAGGGSAGGSSGGSAGGAAGGAAGGSAGGMAGGDAGGMGGGSMEPIDGGMLAGGETCEAPVVLPGTPIVVTSSTTGLADDYLIDGATGCAESSSTGSAPDVVYSVLVPAGQGVIASVTSTWDATINLVASAASCTGGDAGASAFTCLAGSDIATSGTDTVSWLNTTGADVTLLIVIDGFSTGAGDFTLSVSTQTPPPGDTCATAPVAPTFGDAGITLTAQPLDGFLGDYSSRTMSSGCRFLSGADRVYAVTIPPNLRLTARASSVTNLSLSIVEDVAACTAATVQCPASVDGVGTGMAGQPVTETVFLENASASPRPVLLIVDSQSAALGATFDLSLSAGPVPPGEACDQAPLLMAADAGTSLVGESLFGYANDFSFVTPTTTCNFGSGADRSYRVLVPANQRLTATVSSTADLAVNIVPSVTACQSAPLVCVGSADDQGSGATPVSETALSDASPMPREVLVIVDANGGASSSATFDLTLSTGPVPPGDACTQAPVVAVADGGTTLVGQSLAAYANDFSFSTMTSTCLFGSGPDRSYLVTVPSNLRLTAAVSSTADLTVSILPSVAACQMPTLVCVGSADDEGAGAMPRTETTRSDLSATTRDVLVVVDANSSAAASAAFDLSLRLSPAPYTVTAMSGACDSFTGATVTPLLDGTTTPAIADDVSSGTLALPFAFSSFGTPVTHYSVSSNGFLQLYTSSAGLGAAASSNDPIPTSFEPNGVVAPFWDDLDPTDNPGVARVVGAVFGTGSMRRFTVQWEAVPLYSVPGSLVTVQARLYETTNVIELHACSLTAGTDPLDVDRERGLSASVGIESPDGTDGVQASFNAASVVAGQVVRYTP